MSSDSLWHKSRADTDGEIEELKRENRKLRKLIKQGIKVIEGDIRNAEEGLTEPISLTLHTWLAVAQKAVSKRKGTNNA